MASAPKKESPTEPFKRALGLAVRAIAGDGEVQVNYAPGKPEIDGKLVQLPEPSRVPSAREVAVIRGWADSLALTAACHDAKVHARLAPSAGPARAVFEAVSGVSARIASISLVTAAGSFRWAATSATEMGAQHRSSAWVCSGPR